MGLNSSFESCSYIVPMKFQPLLREVVRFVRFNKLTILIRSSDSGLLLFVEYPFLDPRFIRYLSLASSVYISMILADGRSANTNKRCRLWTPVKNTVYSKNVCKLSLLVLSANFVSSCNSES